jgi:predicted RNA-binding Zn ribbon-like protein
MAVHAGNLALLGGGLCLHFINMLEPRGTDHPREFLRSLSDLVDWSHHTGLLTDELAQRLRREAESRSAEAASVSERAVALRENLYGIFSAIAQDQPSPAEDLDRFNALLRQVLARLRIIPSRGSFAWDWRDGHGALDQMLWPVVCSAADLLTSGDLDRAKQCDGCGWLFVDGSRSRTRRWCDVRICGNRAKARRHYERQRKRQAE